MPQPETDLKTLLEQNGQVETPQETKTDPKPQPKERPRWLRREKVKL